MMTILKQILQLKCYKRNQTIFSLSLTFYSNIFLIYQTCFFWLQSLQCYGYLISWLVHPKDLALRWNAIARRILRRSTTGPSRTARWSMTRRNIGKLLKHIVLEIFNIHQLCHTFCSEESSVGVPPYKTHMKLTIFSVTMADYGMYKCVAKNPRGETDGTIRVYGE